NNPRLQNPVLPATRDSLLLTWEMEIPDWEMEVSRSSDDEVSVEKSRHYRLGPDNLDDTLEYDPAPCDPAAPVCEDDCPPETSETTNPRTT
ncbi:hypothetical protein GDO81_003096, partial [Engystomops pustulosus]